MKSNVFYFTARTHSHEQSMSKYKGPLALKKLGIEQRIEIGDKVVIKAHYKIYLWISFISHFLVLIYFIVYFFDLI